MNRALKTLRSQKGQGATEYIIIAILVALVVLFAVNRFGNKVRSRFAAATQTVGAVNVVDITGVAGSAQTFTNPDTDTAQAQDSLAGNN